jgi:predicted nuclease with TOPRIM domain
VSALYQWRVAGRLRDRCLVLDSGLASLRRELEVTTAETVLAESKLKRIEQDFSSVSDRMTALESRAESPSFDQAIDSARRGAEPDKLAQRFGLSRGEADLVTRLHGRTKTR